MSEKPFDPTDPLPAIGLDPGKLRKHARATFWTGVGAIVLGVLAVLLPGIFTLGIEIFIGSLLLVAGGFQTVGALGSFRARHSWLALLTGLLTAAVGLLFLLNPFQGAAALTALLGAFFLVAGMFRLLYGIRLRGTPGSGWGVFNGIVTLALGVLVLAGWPETSLFILGLFLGIDLIFLGFFLTAVGGACRRASEGSREPESGGTES